VLRDLVDGEVLIGQGSAAIAASTCHMPSIPHERKDVVGPADSFDTNKSNADSPPAGPCARARRCTAWRQAEMDARGPAPRAARVARRLASAKARMWPASAERHHSPGPVAKRPLGPSTQRPSGLAARA
jgi:hypothetical protein